MPRPLLPTLALIAVLLLAACSAGGDNAAPGETSPTPVEDLTAKPEFDVPDGDPPAALQVEDIAVGDGPEVSAGDTVAVHYVGKSWSNGEQFDASWDRGELFEFTVGEGRVIPGWERGILGDGLEAGPMHVGGRRMLIIPPDLAYGDSGAGVIAPGETLVFVVDVEAIRQP